MRIPAGILVMSVLAGGTAHGQCARCGGNHHGSEPTGAEVSQAADAMRKQGSDMMEAFERKVEESRKDYQGEAARISRQENAVEQAAQKERAAKIGNAAEPPPPGTRRWPGPPPPPEHLKIREATGGLRDTIDRNAAAEAATRKAAEVLRAKEEYGKKVEEIKSSGAQGIPSDLFRAKIKADADSEKAAAVVNGTEAKRTRIRIERDTPAFRQAAKEAAEQPKAVERHFKGEISIEDLKVEGGKGFDDAYPDPLKD